MPTKQTLKKLWWAVLENLGLALIVLAGWRVNETLGIFIAGLVCLLMVATHHLERPRT